MASDKLQLVLPTHKPAPDEKDEVACTPAAPVEDQPIKKSTLLSLAAELRNKIWEYAVTDASPLCFCQANMSAVKQPPLTLANRQIRHEALPFFYTCNVFQGPSTNEITTFLSNLLPAQVHLVQYINNEHTFMFLDIAANAMRRIMREAKTRSHVDDDKQVFVQVQVALKESMNANLARNAQELQAKVDMWRSGGREQYEAVWVSLETIRDYEQLRGGGVAKKEDVEDEALLKDFGNLLS
ncbi:Hypothetical predicted protein [Lecanosticta acicola]|uniref:Uncharacterized protein n=1 Tax=Lecanosticta acicola TaxID=111012 RepID=A0AAI8YVS3_9PEZI|nr:Hypothetical predicted protein [Lecanosticta acicola]